MNRWKPAHQRRSAVTMVLPMGPKESGAMPVKSEDTARASGKGSARAGPTERLTRADRVARGKDARALAPLESHAHAGLALRKSVSLAKEEHQPMAHIGPLRCPPA